MGFVSRALFVPGHKTLERQSGTSGGAEKDSRLDKNESTQKRQLFICSFLNYYNSILIEHNFMILLAIIA